VTYGNFLAAGQWPAHDHNGERTSFPGPAAPLPSRPSPKKILRKISPGLDSA